MGNQEMWINKKLVKQVKQGFLYIQCYEILWNCKNQQNPRKLFVYSSKMGWCQNTRKKKAKPFKKNEAEWCVSFVNFCGKKVTKKCTFLLVHKILKRYTGTVGDLGGEESFVPL